MTTRRFLARTAALVTASAVAIGRCLVPGGAEEASGGDLLDGWANRDLDIGAFANSAMTTAAAMTESLLEGWANRDLDIGGFANAQTPPAADTVSG